MGRRRRVRTRLPGRNFRGYRPAVERRRFLASPPGYRSGGTAGCADLAAGAAASPRLRARPDREVAAAPRGVPGVVPADPPTGVVSGLPGRPRAWRSPSTTAPAPRWWPRSPRSPPTAGPAHFFPNGCYRSWTDNAAALRPLVDSGQVAFGNHTWSHPDLTTLGEPGGRGDPPQPGLPADHLRRPGHPVLPAAVRGARRPDRPASPPTWAPTTVAMWNGTLDDSRVLTATELLAAAPQWFTAQTIVVGHANHPTVTTVYGDLLALIADRGLQTVTLADVWATPAQRLAAGWPRRPAALTRAAAAELVPCGPTERLGAKLRTEGAWTTARPNSRAGRPGHRRGQRAGPGHGGRAGRGRRARRDRRHQRRGQRADADAGRRRGRLGRGRVPRRDRRREPPRAPSRDLFDRHGDAFDVLVNVAGIDRPGYITDIDLADYRRVQAVNCEGPIFLTSEFMKRVQHLPAGRTADVVHIVSLSAHHLGQRRDRLQRLEGRLPQRHPVHPARAAGEGGPAAATAASGRSRAACRSIIPAAMDTPMMEQWGIPVPPDDAAGHRRRDGAHPAARCTPRPSCPEMQIVPRLEPNFPR